MLLLPVAMASSMERAAFAFPNNCGNFVSEADVLQLVNPGQLLMQTDLFGDLIDQLQAQLNVETREEAVHFYLDHNEVEVKLAMKRTSNLVNEARLALLACRPAILVEAIEPLRQAVSTFLRDRIGRCLYDYLPIGLRSPENYDAMFAPVSAEEYPVQRGTVPGVLATLPVTKIVYHNYHKDRMLLFQGKVLRFSIIKGFERLIDLPRQCAVEMRKQYVAPYFLLRNRLLLVYDKSTNEYLMWRADSSEPLRMKAAVTRQDSVYFELSEDHRSVILEPRLAGDYPNVSWMLPLDLTEPFALTAKPHMTMIDSRFGMCRYAMLIGTGTDLAVIPNVVYDNIQNFKYACNPLYVRETIKRLESKSPETLTDLQETLLRAVGAVQQYKFYPVLLLFQELGLDAHRVTAIGEYVTWLVKAMNG